MREVVVLAGGDPPTTEQVAVWRAALSATPPVTVIAADGGLALAHPLGLPVDLIVGDLDSVAPADLDAAQRAGARIEQHPVDKDATDLALALRAATSAGAEAVTVVGGGGGRADHELAVWLLLADPSHGHLRLRWWSPRAVTDVVHPHRTCHLDGTVGELCSLIPVHGPAEGVHTSGLRFPLDGEDLPAGTSRGVSNQLSAAHATVVIGRGVLVVVRPGLPGPPLPLPDPVPRS